MLIGIGMVYGRGAGTVAGTYRCGCHRDSMQQPPSTPMLHIRVGVHPVDGGILGFSWGVVWKFPRSDPREAGPTLSRSGVWAVRAQAQGLSEHHRAAHGPCGWLCPCRGVESQGVHPRVSGPTRL